GICQNVTTFYTFNLIRDVLPSAFKNKFLTEYVNEYRLVSGNITLLGITVSYSIGMRAVGSTVANAIMWCTLQAFIIMLHGIVLLV
ncbi:hypothetical protein L9F63_021369, partial [Diploptera punctata]